MLPGAPWQEKTRLARCPPGAPFAALTHQETICCGVPLALVCASVSGIESKEKPPAEGYS